MACSNMVWGLVIVCMPMQRCRCIGCLSAMYSCNVIQDEAASGACRVCGCVTMSLSARGVRARVERLLERYRLPMLTGGVLLAKVGNEQRLAPNYLQDLVAVVAS